ncbi:MAG: hypothetical protein DHS80DRAFT_30591 [Piptocephalis tieghemiana]|nr:MAG: hypothetical protein DHS80DRAFT_30591 [Piptocephalis tieghemiana]
MQLMILLMAGLFLASPSTSTYYHRKVEYVSDDHLSTFKDGEHYKSHTVPALQFSPSTGTHHGSGEQLASKSALQSFVRDGLPIIVQSVNALMDRVHHCSTVLTDGHMTKCYQNILTFSLRYHPSPNPGAMETYFEKFIQSHKAPISPSRAYTTGSIATSSSERRGSIPFKPSIRMNYGIPPPSGSLAFYLNRLQQDTTFLRSYASLVSLLKETMSVFAVFEQDHPDYVKETTVDLPSPPSEVSVEDIVRNMRQIIDSTRDFISQFFLSTHKILQDLTPKGSTDPDELMRNYGKYTMYVKALLDDWSLHVQHEREEIFNRPLPKKPGFLKKWVRKQARKVSRKMSLISGKQEVENTRQRTIRFSPTNSFQDPPAHQDVERPAPPTRASTF